MTQLRGRPPSDNPKSDRLFIRVTPEEKEGIYDFARSSGYSLLDLIKRGIEAVKTEQDNA